MRDQRSSGYGRIRLGPNGWPGGHGMAAMAGPALGGKTMVGAGLGGFTTGGTTTAGGTILGATCTGDGCGAASLEEMDLAVGGFRWCPRSAGLRRQRNHEEGDERQDFNISSGNVHSRSSLTKIRRP